MERLGVRAQQAIAIEDSPSGIYSAVGALIRTFGMASTHTPETLRELGAFMTISDFADLQLWTFLNSQLSDGSPNFIFITNPEYLAIKTISTLFVRSQNPN